MGSCAHRASSCFAGETHEKLIFELEGVRAAVASLVKCVQSAEDPRAMCPPLSRPASVAFVAALSWERWRALRRVSAAERVVPSEGLRPAFVAGPAGWRARTIADLLHARGPRPPPFPRLPALAERLVACRRAPLAVWKSA